MSELYTDWDIDPVTYPAGMAITEGQVCQIEGSEILVLGSSGTTASNQATAEVEIPYGVAVTTVASGEIPSLVTKTGSRVLVTVSTNSNGVGEGELVAIEYNTGHILGVTSDSLTIASGDYTLGRAVFAAAAGEKALISWEPLKA